MILRLVDAYQYSWVNVTDEDDDVDDDGSGEDDDVDDDGSGEGGCGAVGSGDDDGCCTPSKSADDNEDDFEILS